MTNLKRQGKYYTPPLLAKFFAEQIVVQYELTSSTITVLDPACGDGELLFAINKELVEKFSEITVISYGFDIDSDAINIASNKATSSDSGNYNFYCVDFFDSSNLIYKDFFDIIITNPPYVRTQQLGANSAQILSEKYNLSGRIDLTHPFVSRIPDFLKKNGVLGILCSNRFLTTKSGINIRKVFVQKNICPIKIIDLGDSKLFNSAVLPAIIIAKKNTNLLDKQCLFTSVYEDSSQIITDNSATLFGALKANNDCTIVHENKFFSIKCGTLQWKDDFDNTWNMIHKNDREWVDMIYAGAWKTFGDIAKIRVGIKTTADKIFISDRWEKKEIIPEDDILLPLITNSNVKKWFIEKPNMKVLYPYNLSKNKRELLDISLYPNTENYLKTFSSELKKREYLFNSGRQWYEIWVPQIPAKWKYPKIVFPDISVKPRFALDTTGAIVNGNCYWISTPEIGDDSLVYLMLAVANSSFAVRFYDTFCGNKLYSHRRRWITQYVSKIPIPNPHTEAAQEIISIVRNIILVYENFDVRQDNSLDSLIEKAFIQSGSLI